MTLAPEPQPGEVFTAARFPGATFNDGDVVSESVVVEMNRVAEEQGWSCRWRLTVHQLPDDESFTSVDLYYPEREA